MNIIDLNFIHIPINTFSKNIYINFRSNNGDLVIVDNVNNQERPVLINLCPYKSGKLIISL